MSTHAAGDAMTEPKLNRTARRQRIESFAYPAAALLLAIAGWELVILIFNIQAYLLPSPAAVYSSLTGQWSYLASESVPTIEEVLLGFAVATVVGISIAVAIVTWRPFEKAVYPLLVASQEVPQIAFAPLLLVWFGFGLTSKVIIAFLIAFFPIVVNASAVVGEFVGSGNGLGYVLMTANGRLDTSLLFAAIIVLVIMGLVLFLAVSMLERALIPWHVSQRNVVTR